MSNDPLIKAPRVTVDGSGAATVTLGRPGQGGIVTEIYVKPVGTVNGNSVATVTLSGGSGATVKTSTSISSQGYLIQMPVNHFIISPQETLQVNISGATPSTDQFNVSCKIVPLG